MPPEEDLMVPATSSVYAGTVVPIPTLPLLANVNGV